MQQSSGRSVCCLNSCRVCCILGILKWFFLRAQELAALKKYKQPLEDRKISLKTMRLHFLQSAFTTCHKIHANLSSWLLLPKNLSGAHKERLWQGARPPTANVAVCGLHGRLTLWQREQQANVKLAALTRNKLSGEWRTQLGGGATLQACLSQSSEVLSPALPQVISKACEGRDQRKIIIKCFNS